ncbi:hypothetical protein GE061_000515 [Apolygus lucorum]|uniref:Fatty acyl-CoA reductase n=1 Tax=Apolygus lucorum TaxID=248454 RepID=A0A6A4KLY0_APOLU|nr:hypothetical protein GE061_000515 [Apolygus lucorum]
MGKVLVEKLLRRCPSVNRLFVVIRTKRGVDANQRINELRNEGLFEPLLKMNPNAFDKLIVIPGDMSQKRCGISEEDRQVLIENTSVIFHTAASVRFDDSLSSALKLNTRGTVELLEMAKEMKKLEVFEYVSTTYCNVGINTTIEERVYPSHLDWKILLKALDLDEYSLDLLVYKLQWTQPNTYTLSKSLTENAVLEASQHIPACIIRPSVVISVSEEPVPGWTDNLNGVLGVTTGVSKGVLRTFKCSPYAALDYIPVDSAINGMLAGAWYKRFHDTGHLEVFNEAYGDTLSVTYDDIVNNGVIINHTTPMENYCWYPFIILTNNTYYFHFLFYFLQLLPALIQDFGLMCARQKRFILRLNIKIYNAAIALSDFTGIPFTFANDNFYGIDKMMTPEDKKNFPISVSRTKSEDIRGYMKAAQEGIKKFIFHEKEENLEQNVKIHWRLYYIDRATRVLLLGAAAWQVFRLASLVAFWI